VTSEDGSPWAHTDKTGRNMLAASVPQAVCMQVSGHRTDSMFRRYAIAAEADIRQALRKTQEYLETAKENVVVMSHR
jgi:hypothetical protein